MLMMAEIDYYELGDGCCLKCLDAHTGCLCPECNCTKCCWYDPELAGDHPCEMVGVLKQIRKEEFIKQIRERQRIENEKFRKKVEEYAVEKHEHLKDKMQVYECQECHVEFLLPEDFDSIIIQDVYPLCPHCLEENHKRFEEWKRAQK